MAIVEQERVAAPVTLADELERVRRRIEEFGWAQGTWPNNGGWKREFDESKCLVLSYDKAIGYNRPGILAFCKALGFPGCSEAYAWNDTPGRTKAEVVAKLRKAEVELREAAARARGE